MKEYLNEQNYQHTKKKITTISVVVLAISILVGVSIMICGVMARSNAEKEAATNQAIATARLAEIEKEEEDLEKQIEEKANSCAMVDMDDLSSWFANTTQCTDQEVTLRQKKSKLEQEALILKNVDYTVYGGQFIMYYVFGGMIIIAGAMTAGAIFSFAKRREISAFTIQQTMPVTQEAIGKMAPTIGSAAKEITKGIREGLKDDPEDKKL